MKAIADAGALADGWGTETATDFVHALAGLGTWRLLTAELGWSRRRYVNRVHGWIVKSILAGDM